MKRFIILVAVVVSMTVCVPLQHAEGGGKVLLVPREGFSWHLKTMLEKEVGVMVSMLKEAGFEVEVATSSGQLIEDITTTLTLKPDLKLADVKVADYAGIIIACMAVGSFPGPPVPSEAVKIIKQAVAEGKPIAAQNAIYLVEAGVLKGKRYAFWMNPLDSPWFGGEKDTRFAGAIYSGTGVIQDGNIITAGVNPYTVFELGGKDTTAKLTRAFINELNRR